MKLIQKFPIPPAEEFTVYPPKGATILNLGPDRSGLNAIWFEGDSCAPEEQRDFKVIPTGVAFHSEDLTHVGSFTHGSFEYHVYECI